MQEPRYTDPADWDTAFYGADDFADSVAMTKQRRRMFNEGGEKVKQIDEAKQVRTKAKKITGPRRSVLGIMATAVASFCSVVQVFIQVNPTTPVNAIQGKFIEEKPGLIIPFRASQKAEFQCDGSFGHWNC